MVFPSHGRARRILRLTALAACVLAGGFATGAAAEPGDKLVLAIVLTRHGVRSPLQTNEALAPLAAQPWPQWEVLPGIQTPRGNALIAAMGDYFHQYFADAGALTGDPAVDGPNVFIRADNDQRTIETGRILGKSLVLVGEPDVHSLPDGTPDPLFQPVKARIGHPEHRPGNRRRDGPPGRGSHEGRGRLRRAAGKAQGIPLRPRGVLRRGNTAFSGPTTVVSGGANSVVALGGPLHAAAQCIEALTLEYADGKPEADVGWGRVDGRVLGDLLALHALYFDLTQRTLYPAQVQGSNLASHLVDTLEQAALGLAVPGAIGPIGERLVVVVGHDTNLANLGGLFGLNWWLPGTQANPMLPGGALVFELWRHATEPNAFSVRVSYVGETLAQMRAAAPLSLNAPPARAPIFIPGSSGEAPGFEAPLAAFVRGARRVIDPAFIAEEP